MLSVFLQRDTFFQVTIMSFVMVFYLVLVSLYRPWVIPALNYLDILACTVLCGIMSVGSGFIEQEVNQASLLVLLSTMFAVLLATFATCILYYLSKATASRYDYTIFLS